MRLVKLLAASVALTVSGAAVAGGHVVKLAPGNAGSVHGHAGLHAVDDKTESALVRIVAPGLEIGKRGTIRVLVKNLGKKPFEFGPDNVSLTFADGSELKKIPLSEFDSGYLLIKREQNRAAAIEMQNRNTLSTLAGQTQSGLTAGSVAPVPSGSLAGASDVNDLSRLTEDEYARPGGKTLDALYQVLMPETVAPQTASGGYLVFELPKEAQDAAADIPLTITVRTGDNEHRFAGLLKWQR
jgi:hypothetical protein